MRYRTEPFQIAHYYALMPQQDQTGDLSTLKDGRFDPAVLVGQPHAISGFRDEDLLGFAVCTPIWYGRANVSVMLSSRVDRFALLWVIRAFRAKLDALQESSEFRRIECTVLEPFRAGHRMVRGLGFVSEAWMRRYDSAGRDHRLYARVR